MYNSLRSILHVNILTQYRSSAQYLTNTTHSHIPLVQCGHSGISGKPAQPSLLPTSQCAGPSCAASSIYGPLAAPPVVPKT